MLRRHRHAIAILLSLAALATAPVPLTAQQTPADTATVLLNAANQLDLEGRHDLAEELLRYIMRQYPGTPAAERAEQLLTGVRRAGELGAGRTGFIIWNTLFGTWLGVAIPAAFESESPQAYGAGILVGAAAGFFGSRQYASSVPITPGQGGLYWLSTVWMSWQAAGWFAVLSDGSQSEDVFKALAGGGLLGVGVGIGLTRKDIDNGTATLLRHAALWGTWYGLALGVLAGAEDDALLASTLVGGNVAILAGIPVAKVWQPNPGRVRLITAAGLAGGLAGLGIDLLIEVDDDKAAIGIPLMGSTVGLIAAAVMTSGSNPDRRGGPGDFSTALLTVGDRARFDMPLPMPTAIPSLTLDGRIRQRPGVQVRLFETHF
jgi:hypothetical protein